MHISEVKSERNSFDDFNDDVLTTSTSNSIGRSLGSS